VLIPGFFLRWCYMRKLPQRLILALFLAAAAMLPWLAVRALLAVVVALFLYYGWREQIPVIPQVHDFSPRFSQFRHDLLNDLQLVYGFVQLNKPAQEVLSRIDRAIARIRLAGQIFSIQNGELSCLLFDICEEAESCGIRLSFRASGKWAGFNQEWATWANGLQAVWAYYKGLAEATGLTEVELELVEDLSVWEIQFLAPGAPVAAATLPKKLRINLGSGANLSWSYVEHNITLQVKKPLSGH